MTKDNVIRMAIKCQLVTTGNRDGLYMDALERFADLVRADEAEKYKYDVHSCGPTCTKVGCVAVRKAVEAEREACAKVCDDKHDTWRWDDEADSASGPRDCAAAIRARGQA